MEDIEIKKDNYTGELKRTFDYMWIKNLPTENNLFYVCILFVNQT